MRFPALRKVLPLSAAFISGSLLFWSAQNVQQAEGEIKSLANNIGAEKENIKVLETEWSYLNRPSRLEKLAEKYLGMEVSTHDVMKKSANYLPMPAIPKNPRKKPRKETSYIAKKDLVKQSDAAFISVSELSDNKPGNSLDNKVKDLEFKNIIKQIIGGD